MFFRQIVSKTYSICEKIGVGSLLRRTPWRQHRLLVLYWHGISLDDEHLWSPDFYIPPGLFRRRLEIIAENKCNVLPLEEGLTRLWAGDLPPRSVAITFDDGFHDFFVHAAPLLEEFGFPATLYLTTYYVDFQRPLFNLITSYVLWKSRAPGRRLSSGFPLSTLADVGTAHQWILERAKRDGATGAQEDEMARSLADELNFDYGAVLKRRLLHLVSAEEVRSLAKSSLLAIEAHTHRHRTPPETELITRELQENRNRIKQLTGRLPVHCSYPSGVFRRKYFPLLEEQGFKSATTCQMRIASRSDNPYRIPRLGDHMNLTETQFRGWLSGLYAFGRLG